MSVHDDVTPSVPARGSTQRKRFTIIVALGLAIAGCQAASAPATPADAGTAAPAITMSAPGYLSAAAEPLRPVPVVQLPARPTLPLPTADDSQRPERVVAREVAP